MLVAAPHLNKEISLRSGDMRNGEEGRFDSLGTSMLAASPHRRGAYLAALGVSLHPQPNMESLASLAAACLATCTACESGDSLRPPWPPVATCGRHKIRLAALGGSASAKVAPLLGTATRELATLASTAAAAAAAATAFGRHCA